MIKKSPITRWFTYVALLIIGVSCAPSATRFPTNLTTVSKTEQVTEIDILPITKSVNGVDVEFISFERGGAYLATKICYEPPSTGGEWHPDSTVLIIENQEVPNSSISWGTKSDRPDGYLCSDIEFPVGVSPNLGKVELVVEHLETQVTKYDCAKAQKKLDEAKLGVVVKCDEIGSANYAVSNMPKDLSDEETSQLMKTVEDAFADTVEGPWKFVFTVQQP
jgi:hypothetical protein